MSDLIDSEGGGVMNGWSRGTEHINVAHIPKRKKPALMIGNGFVLRKVGFFDSEEDADAFCKMLNKWLGLEEEGELWDETD